MNVVELEDERGDDMKKSLADITAQRLMDYFQEQAFEIGDKLPNEYTLAQGLEVGRSTLREAIRMLVSRNIVEVRQGSGTYIKNLVDTSDSPLSFEDVEDYLKLTRDLFEVRFLLEPRMASLAANHCTDEEIEILEKLMLATEAEIRKHKEVSKHRELDIQFHTAIAEASGNLAMQQLIPIIIQSINLYDDYFTSDEIMDQTIRAHRNIFKAIQDRNPSAAYDAMVIHLSHNRISLED